MKKKYLIIIAISIIYLFTNKLFAQQAWQYQTSAVIDNMNAIYAVNADTVFIVGYNGSAQKTTNGGEQWIALNTGISESLNDVCFYDTDTGYAVGYNGVIIKTINGGVAWEVLNSGTTQDLNRLFINSPDNIWAVGDSGTIISSYDYGNTWNNIGTFTKFLRDIKFSNSDTAYIVGNNGTLLKTNDGGLVWNSISVPSNPNIGRLFLGSDKVLFTDGFALYKIDNNDSVNIVYTWWEPIYDIWFVDDSLGYAVGSDVLAYGGAGWIFKTLDGGYTWEQIRFKQQEYYRDITFINSDTGYIIGNNTILKTTVGGVVNIVNIENNLINIYPNPCTDYFVIKTKEPNINFNNIEIYNVLGEKQHFYLQQIDNNKYRVNIQTLSEGIYFYSIYINGIIYETGTILKN